MKTLAVWVICASNIVAGSSSAYADYAHRGTKIHVVNATDRTMTFRVRYMDRDGRGDRITNEVTVPAGRTGTWAFFNTRFIRETTNGRPNQKVVQIGIMAKDRSGWPWTWGIDRGDRIRGFPFAHGDGTKYTTLSPDAGGSGTIGGGGVYTHYKIVVKN